MASKSPNSLQAKPADRDGSTIKRTFGGNKQICGAGVDLRDTLDAHHRAVTGASLAEAGLPSEIFQASPAAVAWASLARAKKEFANLSGDELRHAMDCAFRFPLGARGGAKAAFLACMVAPDAATILRGSFCDLDRFIGVVEAAIATPVGQAAGFCAAGAAPALHSSAMVELRDAANYTFAIALSHVQRHRGPGAPPTVLMAPADPALTIPFGDATLAGRTASVSALPTITAEGSYPDHHAEVVASDSMMRHRKWFTPEAYGLVAGILDRAAAATNVAIAAAPELWALSWAKTLAGLDEIRRTVVGTALPEGWSMQFAFTPPGVTCWGKEPVTMAVRFVLAAPLTTGTSRSLPFEAEGLRVGVEGPRKLLRFYRLAPEGYRGETQLVTAQIAIEFGAGGARARAGTAFPAAKFDAAASVAHYVRVLEGMRKKEAR